MCSGWAVTATDPNFVTSQTAIDQLVGLLRDSDTDSYAIFSEQYPTPVFWADWLAINCPPQYEAFCPFCCANVTDWFNKIDKPTYRDATTKDSSSTCNFPCCSISGYIHDVDFVGTVGFGRTFIYLDEYYREDIKPWELIKEPSFIRWQIDNECELTVFMHEIDA